MELLIWCWHGKLKSKKKYFTDIQGKYLSFPARSGVSARLMYSSAKY